MFDSRMLDNIPHTKVSAWLNRLESELELHFGPLGDVSCERLLLVVLQIVDDHTKTFVQTTLSAGAMWDDFKLALSKRFGMTGRQFKSWLWECRQGDVESILAYFDRLEALRG